MRTRLALGAALVAMTASLSVVVTGLATTRVPLPGGGTLAPSEAAAAELVAFDDCETLRSWYVRRALPDVGPYGLDLGPIMLPMPMAAARDDAGSGAPTLAEGVAASDTGTNTQEEGVDEPDRAKTDGDLVVHLRGRTLVVTDVSRGGAERRGTLRLPADLVGPELLLDGDTVHVLGTEGGRWWGGPVLDVAPGGRIAMPWPGPTQRTRLLTVSLADPDAPETIGDRTFSGTLLSSRQYGGSGTATVRLVVSTRTPAVDFVQPGPQRSVREALAENRRRLRASTIEDWLPSVRTADGPDRPVVACDRVRHPEQGKGYATVTVVSFPFADPDALDATAVTAGGETVYSSPDRLYLAGWAPGSRTQVHSFALDGPRTTYRASGLVEGTVADRWSMDSQDGYLRVAVGIGSQWDPRENGIRVLVERDGALVEVGSVDGLGPRESIMSVRWFGDLAVVVTFRQADPVYTVDLGDPTRPRTLGELKIPGFSEYLHPLGGDRLLGIGWDADADGRTRGGQVSLFDLSDLTAPARSDTLGLGRRSSPAAASEPRAFTWLPDARTALTGVSDGWSGRGRFVAVRVEGDRLVEGRSWPVRRWYAGEARALPLGQGRVALVDGGVRVVQVG